MSTLTRKQHEVQERELRFLDVARRMLIEQGFAGLSMDRLAEATDYSKGTVYQHFSSKEDLVSALAVQSCERRLTLFERARHFQGRPREKMFAIKIADELFTKLNPHYFRSEMVIKMANLEDRVSEDRRRRLEEYDRQVLHWIREIVQDAVRQKDLCLSPSTTADHVVFAMFSLAIGTHAAVLNYGQVVRDLKIDTPFCLLRENLEVLLDGFGWKPLRCKWDYAETYRRITQEVFLAEWQEVQAKGDQ